MSSTIFLQCTYKTIYYTVKVRERERVREREKERERVHLRYTAS